MKAEPCWFLVHEVMFFFFPGTYWNWKTATFPASLCLKKDIETWRSFQFYMGYGV